MIRYPITRYVALVSDMDAYYSDIDND
jgi:hypothetical protein